MLHSTKLLLLLAAVLVVAGVIAGALPIASSAGALSDCGSVFSPANPFLEGPECAEARSGRAVLAWVPMVAGGIVAFGGVLMDPSFGRKPEQKA